MADGNGEQLGLNQQLHALMDEYLALPVGHPQRRVLVNRIVRSIQRSGKLWRPTGTDVEFYEDALMLTWRHFWRNLWEQTTAKTGAYCEPDCAVIARLNEHLRMRVHDLAVEARSEAAQRANPRQDRESGEWTDPIEQVPAPTSEPGLRSVVEDWLEQDETLQQVHVRGKPEITVTWLIREYLLADRKWKEVSAMADVPISTLSSFYDRECRSRLQVFCRDEGYC
jgi:hypothetical protein